MKKIWGKRIGTGVLAISLMLSSLPTQLSIALPHKAKAADTENCRILRQLRLRGNLLPAENGQERIII